MFEYQIDDFMEHCVMKGLSQKTNKSYEQTLTIFARYLKDECNLSNFKEVKDEHMKNYIIYIKKRGKYTVVTDNKSKRYNNPNRRKDLGDKVSDVTINNYIRNIKVFFNYLEETRYIKKNPMKRIKQIKTVRKPLAFIDDTDYKRLINCLDTSKFSEYRDRVIIMTLFDTGMRIGECLETKIEDVDLRERTIYLPSEITKGKKGRYVFFSQQLAQNLKRWLQFQDRYRETDYLFCTNNGKPLQVTNFETNVRKYTDRVGLKNIHPHVFRNNFAKRFLMNGGDIYALSRILGHSSVTVTEKAYLDLNTNDLKKQYSNFSPLARMSKQGRNCDD